MPTVEIPLNNYRYKFRKLNFAEEFSLEAKPGLAGIRTLLPAALVEVSGLPVSKSPGCGCVL